MGRHLLVMHGANLDLLGKREVSVYGTVTLDEIRGLLESRAAERGHQVSWVVSNHEGDLVDELGKALGNVDGILINPGAFTHTSVAIRDALLAVSVPTIEVHLSNIHAREEFRRRSLIADVVTGQVTGLGVPGVLRALDILMDLVEEPAARGPEE